MKKMNKLIISIFLIFTTLFCTDMIFNYSKKNARETFQQQDITTKQYVYPLGKIVGIKADTDGALIIGLEEENVEYIGGLKVGDNIIAIEGYKINNSNDISNILNKLRLEEVNIVFERNNTIKKAKIKTKEENNKYKLGLWVRDKISGIGTLTCYNPVTNEFYAIGHGICDTDTEKLLTIKEGNIYNASNIEIYKNKNKNIGQIKAIIDYNNSVGKFFINSNNGIKGNFYNYNCNFNLPIIEIGKREDVKTGDAYILFQSKEGDIEAYQIKIEKILKEENNMLIKVVDDKLIDYTGGIVKGMSGAPIIQNNKLIGSLTYVFKHNSKKGYGIFIDEMLKL
ncbi:SpoIVB peptidase S55 domain-containing protein [Terrisporobacter sp.]|uniref:SpoIVB peptidase S55 domain-containing protein n=1 Tax=Terrisporobacter sp. TaxID=1965305 RepID=UPI002A7F30B1|nr:SpoIVB peptidase S55 domain-containing protein [Terrisporobacter sp.]MDY4735365.1 SpoIVB peptidase S55 domain-containing protein [Terrisporobacter sp.]